MIKVQIYLDASLCRRVFFERLCHVKHFAKSPAVSSCVVQLSQHLVNQTSHPGDTGSVDSGVQTTPERWHIVYNVKRIFLK